MNSAKLPATTLAALGIVYGDIGTSVLYTLKECFAAAHIELNAMNVMGFVSLIFWSIILVVTIKYVLIVLRADNHGEGGIMVLMQLAKQYLHGKPIAFVLFMGLLGAALFYGDAMITPAISLLSASEGLTVINPNWHAAVLPLALTILVVLFAIQRFGSQKIGVVFGPIMLLWFATLAVLGIRGILLHPAILHSLNPYYALVFITHHGFAGWIGLGAVVLALTGAEALYADMGHFGRKPIQIAWFGLVLPSLVLNYMGQGGLLLAKPDSLVNPFFMLAPEWGRWPLLLLAAFATIIASQAVISGAFSVTRQAIQLGFSPRLSVIHTSSHEQGQIYLPLVNWLLLAAVAAVMLGFQSSEHLAAAYGIAVTGTMLMTSCLLYIVMRRHWHWPKAIAVALTAVFLSFDVVFFSANLLKFTHGGWLPCVVAATLVFVFATWYQGQQALAQKNLEASVPLDGLIEGLSHGMPHQVDGIAIYMVRELDLAPKALLHNLKHNQVLHEHNILLNIVTDNQPYVEREQRLQFKRLNEQFSQMTVHYGFKQTPDLLKVMAYAQEHGYELELMRTSFFLASDSLALAPQGKLSRLRTRLFIWLARNQTQITDYCHIPHNRVVSLGGQIML